MSEDNVVALNTGEPKEKLFVLTLTDLCNLDCFAKEILSDGHRRDLRDSAALEILDILKSAKPLNSGEAG